MCVWGAKWKETFPDKKSWRFFPAGSWRKMMSLVSNHCNLNYYKTAKMLSQKPSEPSIQWLVPLKWASKLDFRNLQFTMTANLQRIIRYPPLSRSLLINSYAKVHNAKSKAMVPFRIRIAVTFWMRNCIVILGVSRTTWTFTHGIMFLKRFLV